MAGNKLIPNLMKWASREEWREGLNATLALHLGPACAKAGIEPDDIDSVIGRGLFANLWGCMFEDFLTLEDADGRNFADDYLKRRGWKESPSDRRYLAGLRSSVMSMYEVSDIVAGESCLMRDLLRGGDPVRVSERSATRSLKQWDRIAARLVPMGERTVLGGGILTFDHELAKDVVELFHRVTANVEQAARDDPLAALAMAEDNFVFRAMAPMFTAIWLAEMLDRAMNPRLPELRNADGDEILFTTVRYPFAPGATRQAVRAALNGLAGLEAASDSFWNWIGTAHRKTPRATEPGSTLIMTTFPGKGPEGSVVLGTVQIKGDAVILGVNSAAREERGIALLTPVLAGLVGSPNSETQTVAELMESRPEPSRRPLPNLSPEDEVAITREFADKHYRRLLDEEIPVLGNKTPRQAARTPEGRAELVAWLKLMENNSAGALHDFDIAWMWEELGVAEMRR